MCKEKKIQNTFVPYISLSFIYWKENVVRKKQNKIQKKTMFCTTQEDRGSLCNVASH